MPTDLQQWPRRRFDRASGQWIEPFNYRAAIKGTLTYVFVALVLCVPIFLICLRIASASHAADGAFAKTFLRASEEGTCLEPDVCADDDP